MDLQIFARQQQPRQPANLYGEKVMEHTYRGRVWAEVRREPYRRVGGGATELIVWQTACRCCGAPFEIKTPVDFATSKAFATVNCPTHRGAPASRARDRSTSHDSTGNDTP